MLRRGPALIVLALAATSALLSVRPGSALGSDLPVRPGVFGIHIESDKAAYASGEPIKIRITLHNKTSEHYAVDAFPPWGLCKLLVTSDDGLIVPSQDRAGWHWDMAQMWDFPPDKTKIAVYQDPHTFKLEEWAGIEWWGYHVTEPGNYTVVAVPTINFFPRFGDDHSDLASSREERSNAISVSISG